MFSVSAVSPHSMFFMSAVSPHSMFSGPNSDATRCCFRLTTDSQRPFKCSYCPYSASQKGNLKTHVLCVHRMPFDNSQYPDRRFKRSQPESDSEKKSDDATGGVTFNKPVTRSDGGRGNNVPFSMEATFRKKE